MELAAGGGHFAVMEFLMECVDEPFDSTLWIDFGTHKFHFVEFFLRECYDVDGPVKSKLWRCLYAAAASQKRLDVLEYLDEELKVGIYCSDNNGRSALHEAAAIGATRLTSLLINRGVDVSQSDQGGVTPVMEACRHGHSEVLRRLLEDGGSTCAVDRTGQTALHYASKHGHLHAVDSLLEHGVDIDCCDACGWTPLHSAAAAGRLKIVQALVAKGANVMAETNSNKTTGKLATDHGYSEVAQYLADHRYSIAKGKQLTVLGNQPIVESENTITTLVPPQLTPAAVLFQRFPRVVGAFRVLWKIESFIDESSRHSLNEVYQHSNAVVFIKQVFANAGWDPEEVIGVLCDAEREVKRDVVDPMCKVAADLYGTSEKMKNLCSSALHLAIAERHLTAAQWLVAKGFLLIGRDDKGRTALHVAANAWTEDLPLVQFLVTHGLDPFDTDKFGSTALHYAASRNNLNVVKLLVNESSPPEKTQLDVRAALVPGEEWNQVDRSEPVEEERHEFASKISRTNSRGRTALHEAVTSGSVQIVKLLLDHGAEVNRADNFGSTPLTEACRRGYIDIVQCLLNGGGNVNIVDFAGRTALHYAAEHGFKPVVDAVLACEADVNCSDRHEWTPLHCAAISVGSKRVEVVKALVEHGAVVGFETKSNKTALTIAVERGHSDVVQYLMRQSSSGTEILSPLKQYERYLLDPTDIHFDSSERHAKVKGFWLDSPIEVKVKKRGWSKNIVEELDRWSKLNHPHVVRLYGVCPGEDVDNPFFVYERAAHSSLLKYLGKRGNSTKHAEVWDKLYEAALGLQYLHDKNIVHGAMSCKSIVVASNRVAKLTNLGSDHDQKYFRGSCLWPSWPSPEVLNGSPPSFESDLYAFGLTIVEAATNGERPWDLSRALYDSIALGENFPKKPSKMTASEWQLIERMYCYDPSERLPISAVIRELEVFTDKYQPYEKNKIGDAESREPTVLNLLTEIGEMCTGGSTPIDEMNQNVYGRLVNIFDQLKSQSAVVARSTVRRYGGIIRFFHARLYAIGDLNSTQASRLAASRQGVDDAFSINNDIDAFINAAGLSRSARIHDWRKQWECSQKHQQREFLGKLAALTKLLEEIGNEKEREEARTYLRFELSKHHLDNAATKSTNFTFLSPSENPQWFIPSYEVKFDKFDEFSRGAFGKVYHGKWGGSRVVVKKVMLESEGHQAAFLNEVEVWHKLYHPNVVQLYGACHVQRAFFVCEYANGGQLDHYLRGHPSKMWKKLYEAALGLRYLHVKRIIHGDLKCNNILVGSDGKAKLMDFGLSTEHRGIPIANNAVESEGDKLKVGAIRWKAPEVLRGEKATFASDVYSFGMCIIEAVSGKYPWGTVMDPVVEYYVVTQKRIPQRPENCSERAYQLVKSMCRFDANARIKMNEVVGLLNELR